jgi:deoxynucleoside triphosphate triphosphohydrolase SAMHD1
MRYVKDSIHN